MLRYIILVPVEGQSSDIISQAKVSIAKMSLNDKVNLATGTYLDLNSGAPV